MRPLLHLVHKLKSFKRILYEVQYFSRCQVSHSAVITISGKDYAVDQMTNVTPKIMSYLGRNLYLQTFHPLNHLRNRIKDFFYNRYLTPRGNPKFSVYDRMSPVVTTHQNFDSLLVPKSHVSRLKRDNYYINQEFLLRGHTTAHQAELIRMGLDNFLVVGDVYRRDEIDSSHYPVFHQLDGVRLFSKQDIYQGERDLLSLNLFENTETNVLVHSDKVVEVVKKDLLGTLTALANQVFGNDVELRWVDACFPFTYPSWELEVKFGEKWVEMLGCGIIKQEILNNNGAIEKVGWAFGLGLERWAMKLYDIPDIRIFWLEDERFFSQFQFEDFNTPVKYKMFSFQPPCYCDISFWLPPDKPYERQEFFELVRNIGPDLVEQVKLIDEFIHPKTKKTSHCYRITYRSWERPLNQEEVNCVQENIMQSVAEQLGVTVRRPSLKE